MRVIKLGENEIELNFINGTKILLFYETPVAAVELKDGTFTVIKTKEKYSKTTTKHINKWIAERSHFLVEQEYLDDLLFNIA